MNRYAEIFSLRRTLLSIVAVGCLFYGMFTPVLGVPIKAGDSGFVAEVRGIDFLGGPPYLKFIAIAWVVMIAIALAFAIPSPSVPEGFAAIFIGVATAVVVALKTVDFWEAAASNDALSLQIHSGMGAMVCFAIVFVGVGIDAALAADSGLREPPESESLNATP